MSKHRYGNIFPLIWLALDIEIHGFSFDAWYAVEIMKVKGCLLISIEESVLLSYNPVEGRIMKF